MTTVVLDDEAVQSLADLAHPKHRSTVTKLLGVSHLNRKHPSVRVLTPTAVRVEAGVAGSGLLRRLQVEDVALDSTRADAAALLVWDQGATAVDATVAELAATAGGPVTVYTSDVRDLTRLLAGTDVSVRLI